MFTIFAVKHKLERLEKPLVIKFSLANIINKHDLAPMGSFGTYETSFSINIDLCVSNPIQILGFLFRIILKRKNTVLIQSVILITK